MDRISPNFIYAFILTISTFGLSHIIFRIFVPELWPLIFARISFPFNILRTNMQNFTKFYITIYADKISVGIVSSHFLQICKRVIGCERKQMLHFPQYFQIHDISKALL